MTRDDDELITVKEACAFIGGNRKPVHPSTLYRDPDYSALIVHPTAGTARVVMGELRKARARKIGDDGDA